MIFGCNAFDKFAIQLKCLILFLLCLVSNAFASTDDARSDSAISLLKKMILANNNLNYEYLFLYKNLDDTESFRYTHAKSNNTTYAYLKKLNGELQEILQRDNNIYYIIGQQPPFAVNNRYIYDILPPIMHLNITTNFLANYKVDFLGQERIADTKAKIITISHKTNTNFYKYKLWIDSVSNLLLKTEVLTANDNVLKTFFVVDIKDINAADFTSALKNLDLSNVSHTAVNNDTLPSDTKPHPWKLVNLPEGFREVNARTIKLNGSVVVTRMYCDELFCFSIYASNLNRNFKQMMINNSAGETLYNSQKHNHDIMIIGEIPLEVSKKIADSIEID